MELAAQHVEGVCMPGATSKASIDPPPLATRVRKIPGSATVAGLRGAEIRDPLSPRAPCGPQARAGHALAVPARAHHCTRSRACAWRRPPCHVEAPVPVPMPAHNAEAVRVTLATPSGRSHGGGAGHRARSRLRQRRRSRPAHRTGVAHDSAPSPVAAVASAPALHTATLANASAESAEVRKVSTHAG